MWRWLLLFCLVGSLYVFFKSETLETSTTKRINEVNIEISSTKYYLHWDRFFSYLQNLPDQLEQKARDFVAH